MKTLSLLTLCVLPALAAAQGPAAAWTKFQRDNGPNWTAEWSPATGTPRAIWGEGLTVKNGPIANTAEARRYALQTLAKYEQLLGRGASTFVETTGVKANRVWIFVYGQRFKGLEVIGGRADVRVHDIGGISMFGSECFAVPANFNVVPRINLNVARQKAYADKGVVAPMQLKGLDRLVIWADPDAAQKSLISLAWEIDIDDVSRKTVGKSYVDAMNGAIVGWYNDYHECSFGECTEHSVPAATETPLPPAVEFSNGLPMFGPMAVNVIGKVLCWTNTGLRPLDAAKNIPMHNVRVSVQGGNSGFTDSAGAFNISHSGTAPVQVVVEFAGRRISTITVDGGTKMRTQVTATPGTPVTIQIYASTSPEFDRAQAAVYWGTNDINEYLRVFNGALPTPIDAIRGRTSINQSCNAYYTNNSINFYRKAGSCNMTAYSTVIYHEWGHGIDAAYGGISQTDGLSEGWGDLIAIYRTNQPVVGQDFRTNGGIVRTALNTLTYPAGGGVHQQGQTWMGWAWDLRQNLIATHGAALGRTTSEKIVLPSLAANARNQPNAVREVFIVDDDDNNLNNGTPNYRDLEKAALKRKLPYPQRSSQNPGAWVAFGVGCKGTGSVPSNCKQDNVNGSLRNSQGYPGVRYLLELVAPRALQVTGFEIKLNSRRSGNVTVQTHLYDATVSGQPNQELASGTMVIGSATAMYKTTLNKTVNIASGQKFFIGFTNDTTTITVGTQNPGIIVPYWRNNGSNNSWLRFATRAWGYVVNCKGGKGAVPVLSADGAPELGTSFDLKLDLAANNAAAVIFTGLSNTLWGAFKLPFDLTSIGGPGCVLLASGEFMDGVRASSTGSAKLRLYIPSLAALENLVFYNQAIVIDALANKLGVAVSNAGRAKIGRP